MQQMKRQFRDEPPMTAPRPKEYGRAEPPVTQRAAVPMSKPALVVPTRVVPETSQRTPERVAKEAAATLNPRKPLVEDIDKYRKRSAPKAQLFGEARDTEARPKKSSWRLFSKTKNIHERSDQVPPYVLSADMQPDEAQSEQEAQARLGFLSGVFRRPPNKTAPKDPAPSRFKYRMHRLWLTPLYRKFLRVGLPAFTIVFGIGIYLSDEDRRENLAGKAESLIRSVQERPEFMVKMMLIEGATPKLADAIRTNLPVRFPASSFDLDLEQMRQTVVELDAVASADLRIKPGGILAIKVNERRAAFVWRSAEGLILVDETGHPVAPIGSRLERADLPIIAGDGADLAVAEATALLEAAEPVSARVRGLVRMGARRWDIVLDRGQRILLPEDGAVAALERVMALAQAEDMLSRDVSVIDMRYSARPTLRLTQDSLGQFRKTEEILTGASSG